MATSGVSAKKVQDQTITETPIVNGKTLVAKMSSKSSSQDSNRWSLCSMQFVGFAMCLDAALTSISLQSFWYSLGGPVALFGLCQGSYDLAHVLMAPFMGHLASVYGYRKTLVITTFINVVGNVMYSFAFLVGNPWYLCACRFVAGLGSCNIGIGMAYISKTSTPENRLNSIGNYRLYQTVARYGGMFVPYAFLDLPHPKAAGEGSLTTQFFNFYTTPSWLASVVSVAALVTLVALFKDPECNDADDNKKVASSLENLSPNQQTKYEQHRKQFYQMLAGCGFFQFALASIFQSIYANLFAIAAGEYHMVHGQMDMWKPFLAMSASTVINFQVFKLYFVPRKASEPVLVYIGTACLLLSCFFFINFEGTNVNSDNIWQFYVGSILVGPFAVFFYPGMISFFSKKNSQAKDIIGERTNVLMGVFFSISSLARVLGPIFGSLIIYIVHNPHSDKPCNLEDIAKLDVSGCELKNADLYFPVLVGLVLILGSGLIEYFRRHHNYKKIEL